MFDPNVIISALLAPRGAPAEVLRAWLDGAFELVEMPRREARMTEDPEHPPSTRSPDPGDDYLIALGATVQAAIVSGDGHLLGLAGELPVYSPTESLALLDEVP
ncbi:MAG: hypothetical protein U0V73_01425 [Acidimicrobiia bacterium]